MGTCSGDVANMSDFPSFVNMTEFFILRARGENLEAAKLLSPNGTVKNFSSSTCIEPSMTVDGFSRDIILITIYGWILILTSVLGILGNVLVVTVYLRKPQKLTTYKWLLVHLAMCDFLFAIFQIVTALPTVANTRWLFRGYGCKVYKSFASLGALVAVGTMFVIAIERYLAVMKPLKREGRCRRVLIALTFVWLASVVSIIPSGLALVYSEETNDCVEKWNHSGLTKTMNTVYNYYLLIAFFVLPLLVIGFCYSRIMKRLWMSREDYGFLHANASVEALEKKCRDQKRAVKVLGVCVTVFSMCVLPGKICYIIMQHMDVSNLPIASYYSLMYLGMLPYPFHVAVNPLIYSVVDLTFRQSVVKLLGCQKCRNSDAKRKQKSLVLKTPEELNIKKTLKFQHVKWQPLPQEVDVLS